MRVTDRTVRSKRMTLRKEVGRLPDVVRRNDYLTAIVAERAPSTTSKRESAPSGLCQLPPAADIKQVIEAVAPDTESSGRAVGGDREAKCKPDIEPSVRSRLVCKQRRSFGNYPRESKDTPSENAFCRVAPTVRLRDLAILLAGVFSFARPFRLRTSVAVHARFFAFLAITPPSSK